MQCRRSQVIPDYSYTSRSKEYIISVLDSIQRQNLRLNKAEMSR